MRPNIHSHPVVGAMLLLVFSHVGPPSTGFTGARV